MEPVNYDNVLNGITINFVSDSTGIAGDLYAPIGGGTITTNSVLKAVSLVTGISIPFICSKTRRRPVATARQLYLAVAYKLLYGNVTLKQIALLVNRDHATVIHASKEITKALKLSDPISRQIASNYNKIINLLKK